MRGLCRLHPSLALLRPPVRVCAGARELATHATAAGLRGSAAEASAVAGPGAKAAAAQTYARVFGARASHARRPAAPCPQPIARVRRIGVTSFCTRRRALRSAPFAPSVAHAGRVGSLKQRAPWLEPDRSASFLPGRTLSSSIERAPHAAASRRHRRGPAARRRRGSALARAAAERDERRAGAARGARAPQGLPRL